MGGGGLLIFYVANVANVANVQSAFWIILVRRLDYFNTFFLLQKPYLCTEFQSALKFQTNMLIVNWHMLIVNC